MFVNPNTRQYIKLSRQIPITLKEASPIFGMLIHEIIITRNFVINFVRNILRSNGQYITTTKEIADLMIQLKTSLKCCCFRIPIRWMLKMIFNRLRIIWKYAGIMFSIGILKSSIDDQCRFILIEVNLIISASHPNFMMPLF
ncbi:hypothetical protein D3C81_1221220 [compost metagenome]